MNLALRDIRRRLFRFLGTAVGLGLLFAVVISMQGIYAGLVDDATILIRAMNADLWVVQRGTSGPFAEASRLDPSLEARVATVPGVRSARAYTYQLVQREHAGRSIRLALVGLSWPDDFGEKLPLIAGRALAQAHGELVVDASLGVPLGEVLLLAREPYRVVGLTRNALTSSGDAVAFLSIADAQLIEHDVPPEAQLLERSRAKDRLLQTDLGRGQPALQELLSDPRFRPPAVANPNIAAVLVNLSHPSQASEAIARMKRWGDVDVLTQEQERQLLLQGVVERAKMQLGLFSVILTITASAIVVMVLYTMTIEKTHDIAVLKLMGARGTDLVLLVLQQAWLLGATGWVIAVVIGQVLYPHFPRRVLLTPEVTWAAPVVIFLITTLASLLGVAHATRVDAGRVLEG